MDQLIPGLAHLVAPFRDCFRIEVFQTFQNVRLRDHLVTTNHVVAETISLTRKIGHEEATRLGDRLYGEKLAAIHWTTPDEERAAFDYFKRHKDQAYSLVDCLHFTHRFIARPGPKRT